jgi:RNA polymerase sigma-70 factor (ECF subfamily)
LIPDIELLDRIKEDPKEFGRLFYLYYRDIFGYAFRRTASFDTAQDIAAETFYKAYLHIKNFHYRGISLKVWLYRIATNEMNAHFRQRKMRSFQMVGLQEDKEYALYIEEDRERLEQELGRHKMYLAILEMVKELPVKYQEVISLRYFEEKSIKEIAQILTVKEGTIKSLLSRGTKILRNRSGGFSFDN